ncbi:MAG TPA: GTP-binding protein [Candidatus Avisuccinivibrio pullicola]|nr:GTP-binding protein [Candidatus Avisuccinivibrio pullicola]
MSENMPVSGNFETIPVYIVTGFLGSGKTTLLNHWVNTEEFKDTLVLINEFGDVGLDHELVQAVDDTVVLLGSGCICCTLQGELIDSLVQNFIKAAKGTIPKFRRVLIETTGLADPSGVISTLNNDDFVFSHYTFSGTITVLDGKNVREQLKKQYEAVKQIALADLILVSKTDLIDEEEVEAIEEIAHKINHSAKILPVLHGRVSPSVISEIGPYRDGDRRNQNMITSWLSFNDSSIASPLRPASVDNPLSAARPRIIAHSNIESFSIVREEPLPPIALLAAIALTAEQYGDSILRIKGILNLKDQDKPVIVHGVMGNLYPLSELEEWPEGKRETKLVFIVRATVLEQIKHIFTQALEHPDAAAMSYYESVVNAADSDVPQD